MGWFLFGSIFLCIVLLPVFLAERWCRRHKAKNIFLYRREWVASDGGCMDAVPSAGICKRIPVADRICR